MSKITERFLKYVSFDTESAEEKEQVPSTEKQFRLAEYLVEVLMEYLQDHHTDLVEISLTTYSIHLYRLMLRQLFLHQSAQRLLPIKLLHS